MRDLHRMLEPLAATYGATVTLEQTRGNHLRAVFTSRQGKFSVFVAFSPSDWRADRNCEAFTRRQLRQFWERAS
jgi:hypothetical protein